MNSSAKRQVCLVLIKTMRTLKHKDTPIIRNEVNTDKCGSMNE